MPPRSVARHILSASFGIVIALGLAACGGGNRGAVVNPGENNADRYLFERGSAALTKKHWLEAREYLRKLVDTYPTSPFRQDAKLGIGDTYLGEHRTESDILAAGEFREFLRFYPLAQKADYAQYRLAVSQVHQQLGPERDQTATRDALKELDTFVANYPQSQWLGEVLKLQRQTRDRLSDSEFMVGRQYYKQRWYPGAYTRLSELMKTDPNYSRRDGVYFFLAETYYKTKKNSDALSLYQKVIDEFRVSEYLKDAKARIAELAALSTTAPPTTQGVAAPNTMVATPTATPTAAPTTAK